MSTNTHQSKPSRPEGTAGRKIPDEAFFIEVGFELLTDRSLDIEEDEGGGDIEEKGSQGEILTWTDSVGKSTW